MKSFGTNMPHRVRLLGLFAPTAAAWSPSGAVGSFTARQLPVATQRWFW
jgi:hypothetical protein